MQKDMANYNNMMDVFNLLNQEKVNYVVLRNYDNLLDDDIYMSGHGDVDLMCDDSTVFAQVIGALPQKFHVKNGKHDKTHYYIYLKNNYVSLDLRHIGDGYYCEKWEKEILERKVFYNGFYVMSKKDYFYTLIYHAIFQKPFLSNDYKSRLAEMAKNLNLNIKNVSTSDFISLLESYMRENNYRYQYPLDKYVPFNKKYIQDKSLMDFHFGPYLKNTIFHSKIKAIELLVKIKHTFLSLKN